MARRSSWDIHGAVAHLMRRAVRYGARHTGYDLVPADFYSPLPDLERLPESLWATPSDLRGVDLRLDAAWDLLRDQLAPYVAEFAGKPFDLQNGFYGPGDAESLYAILRHLTPRTVVELGSGASSHVIALAGEENAAGGSPFEHVVYDPFPFTTVSMGATAATTVHALRTEDVPLDAFAVLGAGDVLFVDTTHTVKTGGDVTRIFLDVLPRLAPGVWVHVHDVFLPHEYPRAWVVERRLAWAEQYLLQAFLAFNGAWDVVLPMNALAQSDPDELRRLIPSCSDAVTPGAFWLRRRD